MTDEEHIALASAIEEAIADINLHDALLALGTVITRAFMQMELEDRPDAFGKWTTAVLGTLVAASQEEMLEAASTKH